MIDGRCSCWFATRRRSSADLCLMKLAFSGGTMPHHMAQSFARESFACRRRVDRRTYERSRVSMGIEIRLFLLIDAFSRFSGTAIACSTGLFLELAKQLLESTAAASGRGRASVGGGVAAGPWRRLEKAPLTPRITRFLVPANTGSSVASES